MKQIWVIDWTAPSKIRNILDEMMIQCEYGKGIHRIPFGCGYVSEEEEQEIADYINSQQPAVAVNKVYYDWNW